MADRRVNFTVALTERQARILECHLGVLEDDLQYEPHLYDGAPTNR